MCCVCSRSPVYMSLLGVDGVSVCCVCSKSPVYMSLLGVDGVSQCVLCVQRVSCLHEPVGSGRRVSVCCVCSRSPVGSGRRVRVCCVCSRSPVYMSLLGVDGVSVCVVCAAGLLST